MRIRLAALFLLAVSLSGCILIRVTDHRVKVNRDGTGEAALRLIDLRSNADSDSLVGEEFKRLMAACTDSGLHSFAQNTRKVIGSQFIVRGDTLSLEVDYSFQDLQAVEGLRIARENMYVVVPQGREIVRTNGTVENWIENGKRIVWDREASRLLYVIREKNLPSSVSLARWYRGRR
jgi:hypothetical protein